MIFNNYSTKILLVGLICLICQCSLLQAFMNVDLKLIGKQDEIIAFKDESVMTKATISYDESVNQTFSPANWTLSLNGKDIRTGSVDSPTDEIEIDNILITNGGTNDLTFIFCQDALVGSENALENVSACSSSSITFQAIGRGVSLLPLILVIILAMFTKEVEFAMGCSIFVGACIVNGSMVEGFKRFLDNYIVNALANDSHQMVILFTFFLSGVVGMMDKSGGIHGVTNVLLKYARSRRLAQFSAVIFGCCLFFDDYASSLMVGFSMQPLFDPLLISREKLAFITDAVAAPIASISPVSAWVGYEVGLIGTELLKIKEENGGSMPDGLSDSAFSVFLETIPYRYYPFFMLFFQIFLIITQREFGPMLIAERKCIVHKRTDGGDGANDKSEENQALKMANKPEKGTPHLWWNMVVPLLVLVGLIIGIMYNTGLEGALSDGLINPSVSDIFGYSDSYAGLLYGTFGTAVIALVFYGLQFTQNKQLTWPKLHLLTFKKRTVSNNTTTCDVRESIAQIKGNQIALEGGDNISEGSKSDSDANEVRLLMTPRECLHAFLTGMQRVFGAIVVLVLAWATGSIMSDIGANRYFQELLNDIDPDMLPTLTFAVSMLMAFATGTSWGTMAIIFPIVTVPAWTLSNNPELVISTIAAVLAGAVAGDHCSYISDTTVLSSIASGCDLPKHVLTQVPYAFLIILWSMLVGTIPVGLGTYSTGVALLMGVFFIAISVILLGAPILSISGRFDPVTEFYLFFRKKVLQRPSKELEDLKEEVKVLLQEAEFPMTKFQKLCHR